MESKVDFYGEGIWEERPNKCFQRERIALSLMLPLLKTNSSILDAGCGDGFYLQQIFNKKSDLKFYGIDNSDYQIKKAEVKNSLFVLKKCDVEGGIPFENETFEFIVGNEIIEHLCNPDLFLSEINRVLKNDGYLLISTPNLCSWFNRILFIFGIQPLFYETSTKSKLIGSGFLKKFKNSEIPVSHVRIFNKDAIKDLLSENGFKVVKIKGAIFDSGFPKWLLLIDNVFRLYPGMSAGFVILAKKIKSSDDKL